MGLPTRATATPKLIQQMVWAGSNLSSYEMASEAILQLTGHDVSLGRIRRQVEQVGQSRIIERDQQVERLKALPLPERRSSTQAQTAPEVAAIMMDGGRYQRRDHFQSSSANDQHVPPEEKQTHWRESKVGCLLSMTSEVHGDDPCPDIPDSFAHASVVQEIAKLSEKHDSNATSQSSTETREDPLRTDRKPPTSEYKPPKLLQRDVVASGQDTHAFGWQLEMRARQLNFNGADRQAFVADGAKTNWRIQQQHFPRAVPVTDLVHALAYAWNAAQIDEGKLTYQKWAQLIWQGDVDEVIEHLETLRKIHGEAPANSPRDPRNHVARALTYFSNNANHMNYPRYRQLGLPITSAHIESTVKQLNRRIKGTEKFWNKPTSESVMQLRADYLSQSEPIRSFWNRFFAQQDGANKYNTASTSLHSA